MADKMTPKQTVHKIANEVDWLVLENGVRNYFVENIEQLCKMAEEYGNHVQQCLNDRKFEVDTKLFAKKASLRKEMDALWPESWPASKKAMDRLAFARALHLPPGCHTYVSRNSYRQYIDDLILEKAVQLEKVPAMINTPPASGCEIFSGSDGKWRFFELTPSGWPWWITRGPVNLLLWFGVTPHSIARRRPTEGEKLMCYYFLLAAIHDEECKEETDIRIFSEQYDGTWFKRDVFREAVWEYYWAFGQGSDERLSALGRVFDRVEKNLKDKGLLGDEKTDPASVQKELPPASGQAEGASNKVRWDDKDRAFYSKKEAIESAHKVGREHEIDDLKSLDYDGLKNILRRSYCSVKHMSRTAPAKGKVHKEDWYNYLKAQVAAKKSAEAAAEKMLKDLG